MNKIFSYIGLAAIALGVTACWDEVDYKAGAPRHQVTELQAVPGDEEVELSWTMPEGWNPSDYIISYTDANQENITIKTGGEKLHLVSGLTNGVKYSFGVQAVYGDVISQMVEVVCTPATSRFPISEYSFEGASECIVLSWVKPGTSVTGYKVTYYPEATPSAAKTVEIAGDLNEYTIDGVENDVNYIVEMVAVYPKGDSEPVSARVMPTEGIPYFVSTTNAIAGQLVTFTFNREGRPSATDVTWTFPGGVELKGDEVVYAFSGANPETKVVLSANTGSRVQSWDIYLNVRLYGVINDVWEQDGTAYNGFKGTVPLFSPDGQTVYVITFNKVAALYAFDLVSGDLKWTYRPEENSGSYNMPAVNPVSGDIYYGTQTAGQFYCVTPSGQLKWQFKGAQSMQAASPAINADGSIVYICDNAGNVFAINADTGAQIWASKVTGQSSGILVNGSELVVGNNNATALNFLDIATGEVKESVKFAKGMTEITGFAVSNDRTKAYIPHKGGAMSLIDLNTHAVLVNSFSVGGNDLYEPVVAPNGDVFVGCKDSNAYLLDGGLTTVKATLRVAQVPAGQNNAYNYSHPIVDDQNRYMITSGQLQNQSIIVSAEGSIVEQWSEDGANQKQMGGNNFIHGILFSTFIGANGENGKFVGKYVGGERAASWCSHGGDLCGSCCVK